MPEKISKSNSLNRCKFCGWKFPNDLLEKLDEISDPLFCELCGAEIRYNNVKSQENDEIIKSKSEIDLNGSINKSNGSVWKGFYETIKKFVSENEIGEIQERLTKKQKEHITRVYKDSDFPKIFKENFIIVFARIIYFELKKLKSTANLKNSKRKLTKAELKTLTEGLKPIAKKDIKAEFLKNLHKISQNDFKKWLKKLQVKLKSSPTYYNDFITYIQWLIIIIAKIVSELWDKTNLPKFEQTILKDLKNYFYSFYFTKNNIKNEPKDQENIKKNSKQIDYVLLNYKYRQIKLKQEIEEEFEISGTTREVLSEISKRYYDKGDSLVAFMPDGRLFPLEEIHSEWLKKNGYNKDSFIFVVPQKYMNELTPLFDEASEQRLKLELDRFLSKIITVLDGMTFDEIITTDEGIEITRRIELFDNKITIKEKVEGGAWVKKKIYGMNALSLLFGMNEEFIHVTKDRIHQGKQVGIIEDSLFKVYIELQTKIFQKGVNVDIISEKISNAFYEYIKVVYSSQYNEDPLYYTLLEFSAGLRLVLYNAGLISSPTYEGLSELNLHNRMLNNLRGIISRHRIRSAEEVKTNLYVELYAEMMNKYSDVLTDSGLINLFNYHFKRLFNEIQSELIPSYADNTIRGEFIKEILKIFPEGIFISRGSLSKILFGDKYYFNRKFIIEERIDMAVHSVIYERIEENIINLDLDDFDFFTSLLSENQLKSIKEDILKIISVFKKFYSGDRTSIKEEFTKKVLEQLFNNPNSPYKDIKVESAWPDWLLGPTGYGLELDGLVKEADFAFEMNGPYHNNPELIAKMFSISLEEAQKKVQAVQVKDQIKIDRCKDQGIDLLIFVYTMDYEKIVEICCKYFADLVNSKNGENVDWRDFYIDWVGILKGVRQIRMESLIRRFNIRHNLEEFEDL